MIKNVFIGLTAQRNESAAGGSFYLYNADDWGKFRLKNEFSNCLLFLQNALDKALCLL